MNRIIPAGGALALLLGCAMRVERTMIQPSALATVDSRAPYLKAHMRDGSLFVLSTWMTNDTTRIVTGAGKRYAVDRTLHPDTSHVVAIDSVAIFETNVARNSPTVGALAIVTGITATVALACALDPKTCFGSCPTFYVTDGERERLQAEGFSASIAPSLEARDVDALYRARPSGRAVRIDMVNEAFETHVVRYAQLLVARRREGERVFHDGSGSFWSGTTPVSPVRCTGDEGDCRAAVAAFDEHERTSSADSADLATREIVELTFGPAASPGLVLATRQSLLPTYLLYQGLAYLGTNVGAFMQSLAGADSATLARTRSMADALGGIDVQVRFDSGWQTLSSIRETGPLASDLRVVPLPASAEDSVRVRLVMSKGAWRVDWAAITSLRGRVEPLVLQPRKVVAKRNEAAHRWDEDAREKLVGQRQPLVTYPGDIYTLVYELPGEATEYELFLDTRGYYLEWMREEWLAETSRARAAGMLLDPAGSLKRLAPQFKKVEAQMDSMFWRSKYGAR